MAGKDDWECYEVRFLSGMVFIVKLKYVFVKARSK
jgi:hypothetical protein